KQVIFKLDSQGNGLLMDRRQIARQLCIPASADDPNSAEATGSTGMTWAKFRWMCILSGCDYFSGVPGVGLATAAGIVKRTCLDLRGLANKLFLYAKKVQRLSKEQVEAVVRADLTFQYQVVFDPIQRRQCRLNTPPSAAESEAEAPSNLDFAGSILSDNALALQLAHGNVDFRTMEPVADFDPADIGTPNNNKNIPTTNSSKNSSSIIWAGDGSKLDRRIASEASIVGAGNSPYFSSISGSGSAISASLWRTDSTNSIGIGATSSSAAGVGSTERLCRLYSSLSSDSLLAAEVATVAETDEKENSETSARLDDEIPANQAWPADVVEIADLTPSDAPATSGSQQQLRQPEFRQIECKCLRRTSPEKKPSTTDKIIDISSRRQHFRWNWKYTGLQIGKKDDVNKKDSKQPRHDAMKRLSRLSNDRSGTEIRPQRHDAMKRLSRLSNDRSGTEIRPQRHDAMKRLSRLSNDRSGTEIRPQRHDAMKRLSRLSNDRSGTEISYIDEALEMEPNNHVLLSNRCAARLKLGEFGLALQDARKCRTLAPDWPKFRPIKHLEPLLRPPPEASSFIFISWNLHSDAQLSQHVDRLAAVVPQPNRHAVDQYLGQVGWHLGCNAGHGVKGAAVLVFCFLHGAHAGLGVRTRYSGASTASSCGVPELAALEACLLDERALVRQMSSRQAPETLLWGSTRSGRLGLVRLDRLKQPPQGQPPPQQQRKSILSEKSAASSGADSGAIVEPALSSVASSSVSTSTRFSFRFLRLVGNSSSDRSEQKKKKNNKPSSASSSSAIATPTVVAASASLRENRPLLSPFRRSKSCADRGSKRKKAYYREGVALQCLGKFADAAAALCQGLGKDPKDRALIQGLVDCALASPVRERFLPVYEQLCKLHLANSAFVLMSVIGQELESLGQHPQAITALECALQLGTSSLKLKASVLSALSRAHWSAGRIDRAVTYMQQDLSVVHQLGDEEGQCRAHGNLGAAHFVQGDFAEALAHQKQQLRCALKLRQRDTAIHALTNLGHLYSALGDLTNALSSHRQCALLCHQSDLPLLEAAEIGSVGSVYLAMGELDNALECHSEQLRLANRLGSREERCRALLNLGSDHLAKREPGQAWPHLEEALAQAQQLGDPLLQDGDLAESRRLHEAQLNCALRCANRELEAAACGSLGLVYQLLGDYESAVKLHKAHLRLAELLHDRPGRAKALEIS
uniref:Exonuclease 1 n=1 Tax=Macrostomum lignano TaxID=282301 RepID=A0A1I8JE20_9PLAT